MENNLNRNDAQAQGAESANAMNEHVDIIGEGESLLREEEARPYVDEIGQA